LGAGSACFQGLEKYSETGSAGSERWKPDSRSGILPLARGWKPLPRFQTLEKELVCTK